ncbi:DUF2201 family putative metallopeptidase, partial [Phenylobacterium sp.]|uniref:vWA domain-containing protein n=1 Tax=Phenylobacterium sp. TaxID=1871053 RepID=UPI00286B22EE
TRLQKARTKMLIKHPFFATLMLSMPMIETTDIPTAATDMKTLYINPAFAETLDDEIIIFVLAHEVMHVALQHGLRKVTRDHMLWNIACDYAINLILKDSGLTVWDQCLIDEKYRDMSADHIYQLLQKEQAKKPKPKPGQGQGQGQPGMGEPGGEHHSPMLGDLKDPNVANDPAAEEAIKRSIQRRVGQAANVARMAGKLAGGLERFINEIIDPKVPWQELLRHFMTSTSQDEESWSRRNRRFGDVFLPARYSESMGPIIFIGDTSGSIGNDELKQYNGEAGAIAEDLKPESIRIVWCDTKVAGEQFFEQGEFSVDQVKPMGGGGTDMRTALTHVEQYDPEVVVLFTDGYTPWPEVEPDYTLIVCCTTNATVPVGLEVRI